MNFRSSFALPIKMSVVYAPFLVLPAALIAAMLGGFSANFAT